MELAREFGLSSDQLVSGWVRAWRKDGDEALRPKPKGRPKGSAAPKRLTAPDKHAGLKQAIRDSFQRNKHRYGYRRVLLDLRNQGWVVNHKLVYKLMNQLGLKSKVRVKKYNSYKGAASHIATNVLDRCFTPEAQNRVWASDVT